VFLVFLVQHSTKSRPKTRRWHSSNPPILGTYGISNSDCILHCLRMWTSYFGILIKDRHLSHQMFVC
jgi:hypothetical protein